MLATLVRSVKIVTCKEICLSAQIHALGHYKSCICENENTFTKALGCGSKAGHGHVWEVNDSLLFESVSSFKEEVAGSETKQVDYQYSKDGCSEAYLRDGLWKGYQGDTHVHVQHVELT